MKTGWPTKAMTKQEEKDRQTGRTTRMLKAAAELAEQGKEVLLVGFSRDQIDQYFIPFFREQGAKEIMGNRVFIGEGVVYLMSARQGKGTTRGRSVDEVFVDHAVPWALSSFHEYDDLMVAVNGCIRQ